MIDSNLQNALLEMVEEHADTGAIAAFDWDDTCTDGDLGLTIMKTRDEERGTHVYERYRWLCENAGADVGYPYCTMVWAGLTRAEMAELATRVWDEARAKGVIRERTWIKELMAAMHKHNWEVWVVSANPKAFIEVAAADYGIPKERVIAMELRTDDQGIQLPVLEQPAPSRALKPVALKAAAGTPTFAVSDSISDQALLESAKYALAIPTHNDGLRALAEQKGWWTTAATGI